MTPERWQQIEQIFHAALEREPRQRAEFLAQACAGDESLRSGVESLIAAHGQTGGFFEPASSALAADLLGEGEGESMLGRTIGHYKILSLLGADGMGEVYLAQNTRLGRQIVLKLLPAEFTRDKERLQRFEREAHTASALNHPNILTIHEIGQADGTTFMATEFIDGQTLRQRMAGKRMKLAEILEVAIQVSNALAGSYQAGIVHRDIQPEDIMLQLDGYLKVLDFGLAKLSEPQAVPSAFRFSRFKNCTVRLQSWFDSPGFGDIISLLPEYLHGEPMRDTLA